MTLVGGADYDIIDPHAWERLWQVEWKRLYGLYNDAAVGQDEIKPPRKEASTEDSTTLAHHLTHNAYLVEVNLRAGRQYCKSHLLTPKTNVGIFHISHQSTLTFTTRTTRLATYFIFLN